MDEAVQIEYSLLLKNDNRETRQAHLPIIF